MRLLTLAIAGLMTLAPAAAHGPWPAECCSDRDCDEVDAKHVREDGDKVHIDIPPGTHPMWPADGRGNFRRTVDRSTVKRPVTGEWGVCISPAGNLLCVFRPSSGT